MAEGSDARAASRRQFGRQAGHYAVSASHSGGASLELLASWANPGAEDLVLDVATGTGFAAFAVAPRARLVIATDITGEMLAEARRLSRARSLRNVRFAYSAAEHLAFADGSFGMVSCRIAAHHFADVPRFVAEVYRVCKAGGQALLVDTTAPEDEPLAALMNDWERRRDPSHVRNYSPSQWRALFEREGFVVRRMMIVKTELEFEDWVRRAGTPAGEVAILRRQFETAAPEAVAAFAIRREAGQLRFAWDALVLEARKPGED